MPKITTTQAAVALNVSQRRVQALITAGRLPATRIGRDLLIEARDLERVRVRKSGRPRKVKA